MPRKQKTIHYLYKTTCLVTGRYYIGMHSTTNLEDGYMGSGKRLRYSLRKHGLENHKKEILEFFESRELLVEAEKVAITPDMVVDNMCMNIMSGGTGGWVSKEVQLKCSKAGGKASGEKIKNDKKHRELTLNKLKRALEQLAKLGPEYFKGKGIGRTHSDKTKKLMSQKASQRVGSKNSTYGTHWITKDGLNKMIKKEYLDEYILKGWVKGRK